MASPHALDLLKSENAFKYDQKKREARFTMATHEGLEGIVVASTRLSDVDGEKGRLIVAGHDVETLAGQCSFEALSARLLSAGEDRDLPHDVHAKKIGEARTKAFALLG